MKGKISATAMFALFVLACGAILLSAPFAQAATPAKKGQTATAAAPAVSTDKPVKAQSAKEEAAAPAINKKRKPPEAYGTIILDKSIKEEKADVSPVVFPHWLHRTKYTCKVCHTDLGFKMKAGGTGIKMANIFAGEHCAKCHNGKVAFDVMSDCDRCHSFGKDTRKRKIEDATRGLPPSEFGNRVDWVQALRDGKLKPAASLDDPSAEMMVLELDVEIPANKFYPAPPNVLYPHKAHTEVLDCSSCHTDIFEMQKGGNPKMTMQKIIAGQYCGVCHGKVAFPLENCFKCHSQQLPDESAAPPADATKPADGSAPAPSAPAAK